MSVISRIAFIGAGQMGMPMVRRLVGAGFDVHVFARRPEVRAECIDAGATATDEVAVAVERADVVVVCLYADVHVHELALGPEGFVAKMRPGTSVIVHTTGSPEMTKALAKAAALRDIGVVEAPVSGSADDISAGNITVLLGGDTAQSNRVEGVLRAYCDPILHIGPLGSALTVKLLNNALCAAHLQLAGEVERIASTFEIDMVQVARAINRSSGASYAMAVVERIGSLSGVADAAGHFLHKDIVAMESVAAELGLDLGVLGHVNRRGPVTFNARAGDEPR